MLKIIILAVAFAAFDTLNNKKVTLMGLLHFVAIPLYFIQSDVSLLWIGIILLISSADILVDGACEIAKILNIPTLVIGIVIIGLGTSLPELFVNMLSALNGDTDLAFGNIMGSNISNMGLVLGTGALLAGGIHVKKSLITTEIPIVLGVTLLSFLLVWREPIPQIAMADGAILLLSLFFYLFYLLRSNQSAELDTTKEIFEEGEGETSEHKPIFWQIILVVVGLVGLFFGGNTTVEGAVNIATLLGAGTIVLGVIVGLGTSLPELVAAISSVKKGETDLLVGNIVGSNIFNILLIFGVTAFIQPIVIAPHMFVHYYFLMGESLLFYITLGTKRHLNRFEAVLLILGALSYLFYCFIFV